MRYRGSVGAGGEGRAVGRIPCTPTGVRLPGPLSQAVAPWEPAEDREARRAARLWAGQCARYIVERTFAWLLGVRRLRIRYERRADIHEAFLKLGVCIIAVTARHRLR